MRLTTCSGCSRHVRVDTGVCPFCAADLSAPSRTAARVGAVLVGAATISSLSGCPRPQMKYGGPPLPQEQREQMVEEPTDPVEPAEPVDAADAVEPAEPSGPAEPAELEPN